MEFRANRAVFAEPWLKCATVMSSRSTSAPFRVRNRQSGNMRPARPIPFPRATSSPRPCTSPANGEWLSPEGFAILSGSAAGNMP